MKERIEALELRQEQIFHEVVGILESNFECCVDHGKGSYDPSRIAEELLSGRDFLHGDASARLLTHHRLRALLREHDRITGEIAVAGADLGSTEGFCDTDPIDGMDSMSHGPVIGKQDDW